MNYYRAITAFILSKKFILSCDRVGCENLWLNRSEFKTFILLLSEIREDILIDKCILPDIFTYEYYVKSAAIPLSNASDQFVISSDDVLTGITVTKWIWSYIGRASPDEIRSQLSREQIQLLNRLRLAVYGGRLLDADECLEHDQLLKILSSGSGDPPDDAIGSGRGLSADEGFGGLEPDQRPLSDEGDKESSPKITPLLPGRANPRQPTPNPARKPNRKPGRKDRGNER